MKNFNYSKIRSGAYRSYYVDSVDILGSINAAIFLDDLMNQRQWLAEDNRLTEIDGREWFYYTVDTAEQRLRMKQKKQLNAIRTLKELGLIEVKKTGIPPVRYFSLNGENIDKLYDSYYEKSNEAQTSDLALNSMINEDERASLSGPKGLQPSYRPKELYVKNTREKKEYKEKSLPSGATAPSLSVSSKSKKPVKKGYGEGESVMLTDEEVVKLKERMSTATYKGLILELSYYMGQKTTNYKSHYFTLLSWHRRKSQELSGGRGQYSSGNKVDRRRRNRDGTVYENPEADRLF